MKIGVTQMTALLVAVLLVGCAPRLTRGESSGLKWHVTELTTSERPATYIGYKSDGRVKVYRYVVVLFAIDSPSEVLGPYASAVAPNHMIFAACQHKRDAAGRRISGMALRV